MLFHGFRTSDVFNPEVVQHNVRDLDHFHVVDSLKDRVEKGDLLDYKVFLSWANDIYSVADVVRVLDKKEDAGAKEFLGRGGEHE